MMRGGNDPVFVVDTLILYNQVLYCLGLYALLYGSTVQYHTVRHPRGQFETVVMNAVVST